MYCSLGNIGSKVAVLDTSDGVVDYLTAVEYAKAVDLGLKIVETPEYADIVNLHIDITKALLGDMLKDANFLLSIYKRLIEILRLFNRFTLPKNPFDYDLRIKTLQGVVVLGLKHIKSPSKLSPGAQMMANMLSTEDILSNGFPVDFFYILSKRGIFQFKPNDYSKLSGGAILRVQESANNLLSIRVRAKSTYEVTINELAQVIKIKELNVVYIQESQPLNI